MIVEPCPKDIKINLHENISADDVAVSLIEAGHTVVKSTHKSRYCKFAFIPSCVTIVKTVSGYRSNSITPYGLYKSLVKENAPC